MSPNQPPSVAERQEQVAVYGLVKTDWPMETDSNAPVGVLLGLLYQVLLPPTLTSP